MLKKTTFKLKYNLKRGGIAIPDKIPVIGGKRLCGKKPVRIVLPINTMHVCAIPGDVAASKQQEGAPPGKVSQAITFVKEMFFGCAKACMSILKNKFSSKKKPTVSSPRAEFGEMLDFYRLKQVQAPQGFFLTPSALRCSMPLLFVVSVHWCFKGC